MSSNENHESNNNEHSDMDTLKAVMGFDVSTIDEHSMRGKTTTKLNLDPETKMQLSNLFSHALPMYANHVYADAYRVSFPEGLPHTLMSLKQGGFGSHIKGEDGRFVGTASFYPLDSLATISQIYEIASIATSQYYLAEISKELKMVNQKLDSVLEFLYGDKRAELLAEMDFVQYAYQNYSSISSYPVQIQAALTNLQEARKVALKDIEFYLEDLDKATLARFGSEGDLDKNYKKVEKISDCIELAKQVYLMSELLEIFYSQNFNKNYLNYVEKDLLGMVNRCDRRMISSLSTLVGQIKAFNAGPIPLPLIGSVNKNKYLTPLNHKIQALSDNQDSELKQTLKQLLKHATEPVQMCIESNGEVYLID